MKTININPLAETIKKVDDKEDYNQRKQKDQTPNNLKIPKKSTNPKEPQKK